MPDSDPEGRVYASQIEVVKALEALSDNDLARLERFCRLRSVGLRGIGWEDVLQESIARALAGTRRWPRAVPFTVFMRGTIQSIASEFWESPATKSEVAETDLLPAGSPTRPVLEVRDDAPDQERELVAKQLLERVESLFANDPLALAVLMEMANGMPPAEIQNKHGFKPRQYATVQRRIRRTIDRAERKGVFA